MILTFPESFTPFYLVLPHHIC